MRTFELKKFLNSGENINIIYQAKDRGCDTHTHEFAELIFVAEGSCEHYIDGVVHEAETGDLLFVNYGQTHAFYAKINEYYNLLYVPEFFRMQCDADQDSISAVLDKLSWYKLSE